MKARKKPVVVDCFPADAFDPTTKIPVWLGVAIGRDEVKFDKGTVFVKSKEGWVSGGRSTHMIMRGVEGEIYLCENSIFDRTYEVLK